MWSVRNKTEVCLILMTRSKLNEIITAANRAGTIACLSAIHTNRMPETRNARRHRIHISAIDVQSISPSVLSDAKNETALCIVFEVAETSADAKSISRISRSRLLLLTAYVMDNAFSLTILKKLFSLSMPKQNHRFGLHVNWRSEFLECGS